MSKRRRRKRPAGHGTIWQQGGNLWIRWSEGGGRRRSAKFPDKETAEGVLAKVSVSVAASRAGVTTNVHITPTSNAPTLSELAKPWLERREKTHRSWRDDRNRWNKHLGPALGGHKPAEVNSAIIRRMIETKLAAGLSSTTVGHLVRLLSTFYSDVVELGDIQANPVRSLPRSTRRLIRNAHDPKQTPFIEKQEDIRRVFLALEQPFSTLFAVQALGGLRPGEALALEWGDIHIEARRILVQRQVRHGRVGPPKSGKPRVVPIIDALAKILAEFKLATGAEGKLFPPGDARGGGVAKKPRYLGGALISKRLREAFKGCGLPETMTVYSAGRHTYGAQHVMGGGSLAALKEILGHSGVQVTERYGHLRADLIKPADLLQLKVDLSRPSGELVDLDAHRAGAEADCHPAATTDVDDAVPGIVSTGVR